MWQQHEAVGAGGWPSWARLHSCRSPGSAAGRTFGSGWRAESPRTPSYAPPRSALTTTCRIGWTGVAMRTPPTPMGTRRWAALRWRVTSHRFASSSRPEHHQRSGRRSVAARSSPRSRVSQIGSCCAQQRRAPQMGGTNTSPPSVRPAGGRSSPCCWRVAWRPPSPSRLQCGAVTGSCCKGCSEREAHPRARPTTRSHLSHWLPTTAIGMRSRCSSMQAQGLTKGAWPIGPPGSCFCSA